MTHEHACNRMFLYDCFLTMLWGELGGSIDYYIFVFFFSQKTVTQGVVP